MTNLGIELIPRIWVDKLLSSLQRQSTLGFEYFQQEQERHRQRMATNPEYVKAYELQQAELEALSYWDALYENQRLDEDEDYDY